MNRTLQALSALALVLGSFVYATASAAGDDETQLASKCYPMERILVSAGKEDTKVAGAAQQLLNKMRSEGLEEFIVLEAGGFKVLCGSPESD